jgi:hypothetical protein
MLGTYNKMDSNRITKISFDDIPDYKILEGRSRLN